MPVQTQLKIEPNEIQAFSIEDFHCSFYNKTHRSKCAIKIHVSATYPYFRHFADTIIVSKVL